MSYTIKLGKPWLIAALITVVFGFAILAAIVAYLIMLSVGSAPNTAILGVAITVLIWIALFLLALVFKMILQLADKSGGR